MKCTALFIARGYLFVRDTGVTLDASWYEQLNNWSKYK